MSQEKFIVAYLGPPSSYTHQVALKTFDHNKYTLSPQVSIQDVFQAVQSSNAITGVVPFENSSNGSVIYTLDLFADRQNLFPSITVCDEAYLDIHHYLLGHPAPSTSLTSSSPPLDASPNHHDAAPAHPARTISTNATPLKPRTNPLIPLTNITRIYSHPQAFGQCELFLSTYLPHAERQEVASTSAAATLVSQDTTGTSAAISSLAAAETLGLRVLGEGIEDREDNCTRFLMLRRINGKDEDATVVDGQAWDGHKEGERRYKTLVSFTIPHSSPGALADALMVFKTHVVNLTSINSRPSRVRPWHYIFFVEFEGRTGSGKVDGAMGELQGRVEGWRLLGSWMDRLER
ncbi:MAG: prephenate dehydratase [Pleopsidium flavum]|nr:MAG: prephenate dehydratase [Pleopsidium flavum]